MYRSIVYIILMFLLVVACRERESVVISPEQTTLHARFSADTISVRVASGGASWSATSTEQWCVVDRSGGDLLRLVLHPNTGRGSRQCLVSLHGGDQSVVVKIVQLAAPGGDYMRWCDSMALVETWRMGGGENWEWWFEHKPVEGWDFDLPINVWCGVETRVVDGSLRVISLNLSQVGMSGSLPSAIGRLSELSALYVASNEISGDPVAVLAGLNKLETLNLSYTSISMTGDWALINGLAYLSLSGVDFSRNGLPSGFAKLVSLQWLYLDGCRLGNAFPVELRSLVGLRELSVSDNKLSSELPHWIGELVNLEYLDFSLCDLSGTLPHQMRGLVNLRTLKGAANKFTGDVPEVFAEMKNLQVLNFGSCAFDSFPLSATKCEDLRYLDFSFNNIQGTLPVELLALGRLEWLMVAQNRMSGQIDSSILSSPLWASWKPKSLVCPQQVGYGFVNCVQK